MAKKFADLVANVLHAAGEQRIDGVVPSHQELSMPPRTELEQVKGLGLWGLPR